MSEDKDIQTNDSTSLSDTSKQLIEKGIYLINQDITIENINEIYLDILLKKVNNYKEPLTFIINSPGGAVNAAWSLIDLMDRSSNKIITIGTGEVASAATMIFANGTKGQRQLTKNTSVLIHEASCGAESLTMTQHKASLKGIEQEHKRHINFWLAVSNLRTEAQVRKTFLNKQDNYFTPEECLSLGIADKII